MTLDSMKEWLASWGDGTNCSDESGATVPVTKESLRSLIVSAEKMRSALQQLRGRAIGKAIGSYREFSPASGASIVTICDDALDGV